MTQGIIGSWPSNKTQAADDSRKSVVVHAKKLSVNSSGTSPKWKRKVRGGKVTSHGTSVKKKGRGKRGQKHIIDVQEVEAVVGNKCKRIAVNQDSKRAEVDNQPRLSP